MKLNAEAVAVLLQGTEIPLSMGDADLAAILEARGIRALSDDGPAPVDRALGGLQPERLRRAGVFPGKASVGPEVTRRLEVLRDVLDDAQIQASQAAIADALDMRDGWWLRSRGLRAVGREAVARLVLADIRSLDDFLMADDEAFEVVVHLAERRCQAAFDPSMTIWRLVAAFGDDLDDADDESATADALPSAAEQESTVYRTPPRQVPLVIVSRDGKLSSAALAEFVAGQLDQKTRENIQDRLDADAGERGRLEAHRQAFAARELARTSSPPAPRNSVEWAGDVTILLRREYPRMAASGPSEVAGYSEEMGFELVPGMGDGGDTHVAIDAWVNSGDAACRLEIWAQGEPDAVYALHAVYPLRADGVGRVSCDLPLMSLAAASLKFRLVRE